MAYSLTFGVIAESVRKRYFPHQGAWTANSTPTAAEVLEIITDAAATLDAKLRGEDIDPTSIADVTDPAFRWSAHSIRLKAAIDILRASTAMNPALAEALEKELEQRWKDLERGGYVALGEGVAAPATQADGPTHHLDEYAIALPEDADLSDLDGTMPRRSDEL